MRRRGFTLLELVAAIAIGGVVALLVYATAAAGFDTRDALARHRSSSEATSSARALLTDALRHLADDVDGGTPAFSLTNAVDAQGRPADRLTFITRGIEPPFGAGEEWRVEIVSATDGVVARGWPASRGEHGGPVLVARAPGVHAVDVHVRRLGERAWMDEWATATQSPSAVWVDFVDAQGRRVGTPLIVQVGLEAMR